MRQQRSPYRGSRAPRPALRPGAVAVAIAVLVPVLLVGAVTVGDRTPIGGPVPASAATVTDVVELLPLSTSPDRRIVDSRGRDVLLRGANVNSLGEYWQGDPAAPATVPVTDADWAEMAAHGFSVVRLLVTWSRIEPQRGVIDHAYLDAVDEQVRAAAAHGIYSVIDMHQDAYSAFIFTTDPASCPSGTSPGKGWDGAPAWATLTDGLSTCTNGDRNSSPAVNRAWNNFYDNVDGIRDEFVAAWRAVATRFAGRPEVAGYDLLNEPEASRPSAEMSPLYEDLLEAVILAIRDAESVAPFGHLLFVEPALPAGDPSRGLVIPNPGHAGLDTTNIVASAHNYAESITVPGLDLTIEGLNQVIQNIAASLGVATWGGEYGFWDTSPPTLEKVARYAADEDRLAQGGAWWQWRQSCGDPHHVQWQGGTVVVPAGTSTHLNRLDCPGNIDLGPTTEFLHVLGRAYPRATPGRITALSSDPASGVFSLEATAGVAGGQLVVWTPTSASPAHTVTVAGLVDVVETVVPGGRIVTATVADPAAYSLQISYQAPTSTTTIVPVTTSTTPPTTAGAPTPVNVSPSFAG